MMKIPMHLFIDANVFLSFYEASPDALLELAKIAAVIEAGKATLWLPDQVRREFWKNREGSIGLALREFEKSSGFGSVPRLVREHAQFKQLTELAGTVEKKKAEIVAHVMHEVADEKTAADREVRRLFDLAREIDTSGEIFVEAHERALRRSPPGKQDGLGDRLAWVALLKAVPANAELHVISVDGDFASEMNQNEIKPYLQAEWAKKKRGVVKLWKRASQFLAAHFPDATSAIAIEQTLMVESLEKSPNFATTHSLIAEFSDLSHLSQSLVDRLANAILNNSQIRRLRGDDDVKKFITDFLCKYQNQLAASIKNELEKLLQESLQT
jgi:PIN domain